MPRYMFSLILLIFTFAIGCKSPTAVMNNTTNAQGSWVGATADSVFPVVLIDSLNDALIPKIDTTTRTVSAIVYNWKDSSAVIYVNDSALPSRAVVYPYEILFANYSDSSVDIVITDTAGDIGVQTKVNVRDQLSKISIHSNKINKAFQSKNQKPQDELPSWLKELKIGSDVFGFVKCTLPVVATIGIFTGQPELIYPQFRFGPSTPDDFLDCGNQFLDALEKFINAGTSIKQYIESLGPIRLYWTQAQWQDQYISNKPGNISYVISSTQSGCVDPQGTTASGSCQIGNFNFGCRSNNGECTVGPGNAHGIIANPAPSFCNWNIEAYPQWVKTQSGEYGIFSTTQDKGGYGTVTFSGSYHY
jgi:hypothetical protein